MNFHIETTNNGWKISGWTAYHGNFEFHYQLFFAGREEVETNESCRHQIGQVRRT